MMSSLGARLLALDGLRGISFLTIFFFHTRFAHYIPGGGLGATHFFVLSGFLITLLLTEEWNRTGRISIRDFYWRRIVRLGPAAVFFFAIVFAFLLIFQGQPVVEGRQFLNGLSPEYVLEVWALTMLGVFNWVVASGIPFNPFTHLWSLGVEQQFYLLWPPVLIILLRMNQMKVTLTVLLVAAGGSLFLGQWMPGVSQRHLLFGTDGAAYAILVGAIAALIWPKLKDVRIPPPFVLAAFAALVVHVFHPIPIEEVSRLTDSLQRSHPDYGSRCRKQPDLTNICLVPSDLYW